MTLASPDCPLCGHPPLAVLAGNTQAFCRNPECIAMSWNPSLTAAQNREHVATLAGASDRERRLEDAARRLIVIDDERRAIARDTEADRSQWQEGLARTRKLMPDYLAVIEELRKLVGG